jgi:NAD(P)-dependent dehydrogenase (short-subunit alcohol dehydrogenase family)
MTPSPYFNIHSTKHTGKVALVTGGSTGIGLATAKRLAREGATVFITGRRQEALDAAVEEIGHGAQAIRGDNSSAVDIEKITTRVSSTHTKIDILFANAGGGEFAPLGGITEAQFDKYAATKAALRSFARSWAVDLKGRDIRVNVVSPGVIVTPGYKTELKMSDEQIAAYSKEVAETTPLGRVGEADEIAKAVSFLASDDASYITGIELFVDGGRAQI